LEGLTVKNAAGVVLGKIDHLTATAAHDVLVLEGDEPRLIPFVVGRIVRRVDLEAGVVIVDWDESYWD
jgi:16S rRNA processing protein RimM